METLNGSVPKRGLRGTSGFLKKPRHVAEAMIVRRTSALLPSEEFQLKMDAIIEVRGGRSMEQVRAVVVDPDAVGRLAIKSSPLRAALPSQALVRVKAISLNLGEVRRALTMAEPGWRPGWDLAGVVEQPAADHSGPPAGARVVGFLPAGGWAEAVTVPTNALAQLPDSVSFAQAATLPVAGLTALYSLEQHGAIIGRRVLVTGASGGVGHLAVELANRAGAFVVASVRRLEREKHARSAGAHEVVVGEDPSAAARFGPYDLILES